MSDSPENPIAESSVIVCNRRGLHARAAARFVRMVENRDVKVTVTKDGTSVCGSSIMGLLMLSAGQDSCLHIRVEGARADHILRELVLLVEQRFDEDE